MLQRNAQQVLLGKKTNVLLVRDDIGRAKPSTRDLPDSNFSFGKPEILPDRITAELSKIWFIQLHILLATTQW